MKNNTIKISFGMTLFATVFVISGAMFPVQSHAQDYGYSYYEPTDYDYGYSYYEPVDYGYSYYEPTDYGYSYYEPVDYGYSYYEPTDYGYSYYEPYDYSDYFVDSGYEDYFVDSGYDDTFVDYGYEDYFVDSGYDDYFTDQTPSYSFSTPVTVSHGSSVNRSNVSNVRNVSNVNNKTNVKNIKNETNKTTITRIRDEQRTVSHQFDPVPTCSISVHPSTVLSGGAATATWSSSDANSAHLSGVGSVGTSGAHTFSNITSTKTFTLTVHGDGGSNVCSTTITVKKQAPTCTLNISPDSIDDGDSASMHWSSSNAVSATINQGIGSVSTSGSRTIFPNSTRTYTMTVTSGDGQTATCSDHVFVDQVSHDAPTCSISVHPSSILSGSSATLIWNSSNATSAHISNVGSVSTDGSRTVSPNSDTTYTLTVSGSGGSRTCSTHLDVQTAKHLSCTISAHPSSIRDGNAAVLSWTSVGAVSAWLSDSIGSVATDGSLTVRPEHPRTYTLTVSDGHGDTRTCSTHVDVFGINVSLTQVPHTGFDFGPVGNTVYWFGLLSVATGAGYVFVKYKASVASMTLAMAGVQLATDTTDPVERAQVIHEEVTPAPSNDEASQHNMMGDVMTLEDDGDEGTMPSIKIRRN